MASTSRVNPAAALVQTEDFGQTWKEIDLGLDVEVAGTLADAGRLLDVDSFDVAVLDVNLSGETSFAIADRLLDLGLPFVFATGYGESIIMPGATLRMALGGVQAALAGGPSQ